MWTLDSACVLNLGPKDFCFRLTKSKYHCTKAAACFLSEKVARLVAQNPDFSVLRVRHPDRRNMFQCLMEVLAGGTVDTSAPGFDLDGLLAIVQELENKEMYSDLMELKWNRTQVTADNVWARIKAKETDNIWPKQEIDFLAENFDPIFLPDKGEPQPLSKCGFDIASAIIQSSSLTTDDYDGIAQLIIDAGPEFASLLMVLPFEKVSSEVMETIIGRLTLDDIDDTLWHRLCRRLIRPIGESEKASAKAMRKNAVEYPRTAGAFQGVIAHLNSECGRNAHKAGAIELSSSGDDWNHCYQLIDYGWHSYFYTRDQPGAYVQIDFRNYRVECTGYSLRYGELGNCGYPIEWAFEASDNGNDWVPVDERNCHDLNGDYVVATYDCNQADGKFHRYFRMRLTGENSRHKHFLLLSEIEVFGFLLNESE